MIDKNKRILISSALPYVNGLPHLGHLIGCLLSSDVFARFMRLRGFDVMYVGGVDFHGSPAELGAIKEAKNVEDYCNDYAKKHKEIYDGFLLSFDCFGSTHSKENQELVYEAFEGLEKNGFIFEKTLKQVFSKADNMFLADRYIEGTCPYCGYEKARGDQCENCTKLLDPSDLLNPVSAISGSSDLEITDTKHLFLQLQDLQPELEKWLKDKENNSDNNLTWDKQTYGIAKKWVSEGLKERCITRDLKWGFVVPRDGYENKVFYVWFDAPFGYLSIVKEKNPARFDDFWKKPDETLYFQFMGKDNVPFHAVFFPSVLIGAGDKYKKVDVIKSFSFLNYEGGKFSKSAGRGVFAEDALKELPCDYWRYWLLCNTPESDDVNFSFAKFASDINKDLNDILGNFILRVLKFYNKKYGDVISEIPAESIKNVFNEYNHIIEKTSKLIESYTNNFENLKYRKAMEDLRAIWVIGNEFIDYAAPWVLDKTDSIKTQAILIFAMNLIRIYAVLLSPVCPTFAKKILDIFGIDFNPISNKQTIKWVDYENMIDEMSVISFGQKLNIPDSMFNKISDEQVELWKEKFKA